MAQLQSNVTSKVMGRKSIVAAAETAAKISTLAEKGAAMARAIGRKVQGPRLARMPLALALALALCPCPCSCP